MKKVFDTSAFLNRFFFNDIENVITTNSVLKEIKNKNQKLQIDNLIQNSKIEIRDPSKEILEAIKKKAPKMLSETDVEVIALAKELNLELHTDDFMMRKICKDLKINVKPVAYDIKNKNILDDVYEKIKPTDKELLEIKKVSKGIITKLNTTVKKGKYPVKKILLAGSSARGTFLHNKKDLDIFILFDLKLSVDKIKRYNIEILKKTFPKTKFIEEYGEHPYLKAKIKNISIDFVPGFYITNIKQRKSSVDRTPLHLKYLNKNQNKELKKQVILLKQFLKNNLLYGADQKNKGFSGYLTELLILKFGTFENVLKAFSDLDKNKYLYLNKVNTKKKFDDFLVFIDPTDENRNVASAVTKNNWKLFSHLSKQYLDNPKSTFFFGNCYNIELPQNLVAFEIKINGKTPDSNWGIIKGLTKRIKNELKSKNYNIKKYSGIIHKEKGLMLFEVELKNTIRGPILTDLKNVKAFKKKHKKAYKKDNRLFCDIKKSKTALITDIKKICKKLTNNNAKEIKLKSLELNPEEIKRIKKDFFTI